MIQHQTPNGTQQILPEDVSDAYVEGNLSDLFGDDKIQTQLDRAEARILALVPGLEYRIRSGKLPWAAYVQVICDVVLRVLRNPSGYQNENDGSYSYGRNATVASGNIWLTNDDLAILSGVNEAFLGTGHFGVSKGWR